MSYLPGRQNFKVWVGSTFNYRFQWLDQADNINTPHNVTGFEGSMPIVSLDGLTTYQTLTDKNGGIVFSGTTGLIDLVLMKTQTEDLGWTYANYTLSVVDPVASETLPLLTGRLTAVGAL